MDTLTLVAALILAGVFGIAGVAKLRDRTGTRVAVRAFGAPAPLVPIVALVLPLAELAVAGALVFPATRFAGAVGALGLLVLFTAAIAVSLARGKTPECHCFGQLHSAPTSWKTLVRNGLLGAIAGGPRRRDAKRCGPVGLGVDRGPHSTRARPHRGRARGRGSHPAIGASFLALTRAYGRVLIRLDATEKALQAAGIEIPSDAGWRDVGARSRPRDARTAVRDAALQRGSSHARRPPRPGASVAARLHEPGVRAVP